MTLITMERTSRSQLQKSPRTRASCFTVSTLNQCCTPDFSNGSKWFQAVSWADTEENMRQPFRNSEDREGRDQIRLKIQSKQKCSSLARWHTCTHAHVWGRGGGWLGGQQCIPTLHCFETTPPPSRAKMHTRACMHTHTVQCCPLPP